MRYAMILNKKIIDIVCANAAPEYPPTPEGEIIVAVEIGENEMVSLGMMYENGVFSGDYQQKEEIVDPTQADRIEANLDYLVLLNS